MPKVLKYAIAISVGIHLLVIGIIGGTSASKPIEVESLKLVKVDLVKTPDEVAVSKPDQPKPEPEAEPPTYVPPAKQMTTAPTPSRKAVEKIVRAQRTPGPYKVASLSTTRQPAGNPGGAINLGSASPNGENLGGTGTSGTGYVPNNNGGKGTSSGNDAGVGTPEPQHGDSGPGPTTAVAPPPPPPPRTVEVTVCAISGMRPGKYCDKKTTKTFVEGDAPTATCTVCKEPEPVHVNRLADRAEPELVKDPAVRVPDSVLDSGINATVKVEYTVDADGGVSDVRVTDSSGDRELDRAVVDAARKMKYKPAVQDGVPRAVKKTRSYKIKV